MKAIKIRNLYKTFKEKQALNGLNMTVPKGAIYGFIGENGSGKSTTEKIICGLIHKTGGSVELFGKKGDDPNVRRKIGVLIESPGCFPGMTVWNNLKMQADNLGLKNADDEIRKVLTLVRMEGAAGNKYKNCSLGMKQRVGIAMALIGNPELLVLDEPINGLDADGMRIMREVLTDLAQNHGVTVLISSHVLGELEKIATHYGIIRNGSMIKEMTADELEKEVRTCVSLKSNNQEELKIVLNKTYSVVKEDDFGYLRVYDEEKAEDVVDTLYKKGIIVTDVKTAKVSLEEYYIDLMAKRGMNYGK